MKHFEPQYNERGDSPVDISGREGYDPERWLFTFGFGHVDPRTGDSLANHYVVIEGDINESRDKMIERFGRQWAMQYRDNDETDEMIAKYNLKELSL